jgi:hypothetical protein
MNEPMHRAFPTRCTLFLVAALISISDFVPAVTAAPARIVEVRKIWDQGQHNAFTDLIRWRERWWCTFREAADHVGGDGVIRVLESADGKSWISAAALAEKDIDLRDPKFSVTPDGRLMLVCGGSVYLGTKVLKSRQSRVLFSSDGRTWTAPQRVLREGEWLWRVTWHQGTAYGVAYDSTGGKGGGGQADEWLATLYSSRDGIAWTKVSALDVTGRPNEATVRFLPGGDMTIMMRREGGDRLGWFGVAAAPYTKWTWRPTAHRFGGPNFIAGPDGRWLVSTRDHTTPPPGAKTGATTLVARLGTDGKLEPLATLPSGGDTSYAGLVWHEGQLWVSYYASHEGKSAIYLARLQL